MDRRSHRRRWLFGLLVLSSGTLLQTSCSALAQDAIIGLGSAIANSFIQNIIYQALNVSGFSVGT